MILQMEKYQFSFWTYSEMSRGCFRVAGMYPCLSQVARPSPNLRRSRTGLRESSHNWELHDLGNGGIQSDQVTKSREKSASCICVTIGECSDGCSWWRGAGYSRQRQQKAEGRVGFRVRAADAKVCRYWRDGQNDLNNEAWVDEWYFTVWLSTSHISTNN